MATPLSEILDEINALLEPGRFEDYCVNGLQVPGAEEVATIATAVSASAETFALAADAGADLLVVHHGLFWGDGVRAIDGLLQRRLALLFTADIALAAYHLPLDAHPQIGNNALLAQALGARDVEPFARHRGERIGALARLVPDGDGVPLADLVERVRAATAREPLVLGPPGEGAVRTVALVTGAGADYLPEAAAAGADALVTGEVSERSMALARELGVHLIAAGHYATETFGVRRLGEHLAERFGVAHAFIDAPNPI
jgi:dinuclear metal center YbgI/SA1388 family protein